MFKIGDRVIDKDGFEGIITEIYDKDTYVVRFSRGSAIRYGVDITLNN